MIYQRALMQSTTGSQQAITFEPVFNTRCLTLFEIFKELTFRLQYQYVFFGGKAIAVRI